ncbi:hypothetical protein MDOR_10260 [Mycolicibacterium doricum]|uniref:Uncharacterized protein n=1 Tax=Mycolicibacterium doricum TaxID=126673 RepID=A0A7I7VPP6_9MYCO|nr:hypothetical protein MDOR_10260 [Mycolicibacterium doricum]
MITARELAAECEVPVSEVLTLLTDLRELTLTPDSGVRNEAADAERY